MEMQNKFSIIWYYESLHRAASITPMRNVNPYPCILTNSNLFQTNTQVSTCPNDAAMCKSVKKHYPGLNEAISPYYIGKLKGPPSFTDFVEDWSKEFLESRLFLDLICSLFFGVSQDKDGNPLTLVGSWTHFNKRISCKIFWLIIYKISERPWTFQFPNEVKRYLFILSRVGLFNRFTHSSMIRTTHCHFSIGLK